MREEEGREGREREGRRRGEPRGGEGGGEAAEYDVTRAGLMEALRAGRWSGFAPLPPGGAREN